MARDDLYDPAFIRGLFDEMAATYGPVNLLSSFGFCIRWRRQCLRLIDLRPGSTVLDLMCGMGELESDVADRIGGHGSLLALDLSPVMCERAGRHPAKGVVERFEVIEADALRCPLADASVDHVVSTFGLKTFNGDQLRTLADQTYRVLKPGGSFAMLEISVPPTALLRAPYLFYLHRVIPIIGRLALGNPDNYRMLGVYTTAFGNCDEAAVRFAEAGLDVQTHSHFFGCATSTSGRRPQATAT